MDARYEKVRDGGPVIDEAALTAIGIDAGGHREVHGASISRSEAEIHWREFFRSLVERGLSGVRLITGDSHAGLERVAIAFNGQCNDNASYETILE